ARRLAVGHATLGRADRALAINRVAQAVNDAPQQTITGRNVHDGIGALYNVTFLDVAVGSENNDTHVVGFEVQRHALNAAGKFDHFTGLHVVQAVNPGN